MTLWKTRMLKMSMMKWALELAVGLDLAVVLVVAGYVVGQERHAFDHSISLAQVQKAKPDMPYEKVVSILGEPASRTDVKSAEGTDPGLFRATWKSSHGSVAIDFSAFRVARVEVAGICQESRRPADRFAAFWAPVHGVNGRADTARNPARQSM